jgi:hypothetical protein
MGYQNRFSRSFTEHLREGKLLAATIEDAASEAVKSAFSLCYGYISPDLSKRIVKYQNPNKPSYHRWDAGAAADVCFHDAIAADRAPIYAAHDIDDAIHYSRMITYAESEWICIATRVSELGDKPRKAFYENQFVGETKPRFVKYSDNPNTRQRQKAEHTLEHDWSGSGWPSYHGGGYRQYEHRRISEYTTVIDFLYDKYNVHNGVENAPPITNREAYQRWEAIAQMAGTVVDAATRLNGNRVSITAAYNKQNPARDWSTRFFLQIAGSSSSSPEDIAHGLAKLDVVSKINVAKDGKINVLGEELCQ